MVWMPQMEALWWGIAASLAIIQPVEFEKLCARLWTLLGHTTYRTPSSGDGGIDGVAIKGSDGLLIQCKTTSVAGNELGWDGVKDVIAGALVEA